MRRLASYVYLSDAEGNVVGFGPGDDVPSWAAEQITNSGAWATPAVEAAAETVEVAPVAPAVEAAVETVNPIPPKAGPGSSAKAWAAYALAHGFETDASAKASEIREALEAAGIPTE